MGRFELRFDSIETNKEARQIQDFLLQHPGEYDPATYIPWVVDTCVPEIKSGERRAFAWWQAGDLVADAIIKVEDDIAKLRHFRVEAPSFTHRGLGSFAIRQVPHVALELLSEQHGTSPDATNIRVQLDTKLGSSAARFFAHHGFQIIGQDDLYRSGKPDAIMERAYPIELVA